MALRKQAWAKESEEVAPTNAQGYRAPVALLATVRSLTVRRQHFPSSAVFAEEGPTIALHPVRSIPMKIRGKIRQYVRILLTWETRIHNEKLHAK
jgi:hypothetical protein